MTELQLRSKLRKLKKVRSQVSEKRFQECLDTVRVYAESIGMDEAFEEMCELIGI